MTILEYEHIVEFSFIPKSQKFVVRFLDGSSYSLVVNNLPPKFKTKKPTWEEAYLSPGRNSIVVIAGKEVREIPSHIIHAKGTEL